MSNKKKMIARLLSKPKNYKYTELKSLLNNLGYVEYNRGRTSGSSVAFYKENKRIIYIHKPHPGNEVKQYVLEIVITSLQENEEI